MIVGLTRAAEHFQPHHLEAAALQPALTGSALAFDAPTTMDAGVPRVVAPLIEATNAFTGRLRELAKAQCALSLTLRTR